MARPAKTVVLDVVALTRGLISEEHTPFLAEYISQHGEDLVKEVKPAFPALTCTAQATYASGKGPKHHGITANGWYDPVYKEVKNWHQSSGCVETPRIWNALKRKCPDATVFVHSWWHGMHDPDIDFFMNVRPQYLQDGGKKPDVYTRPPELRHQLQGKLGTFPLHKFWGPGTGIAATRWIANAAMMVDRQHDPTLTLVYLPHMDYSLQKYGPNDTKHVPQDLKEVDAVVKDLVEYYEGVGARVILLSEYGISPVDRPVYLNRALRAAGLLQIREECGGETLDCGESRAFAVCDHQVAHIHVQHGQDIEEVAHIYVQHGQDVEEVRQLVARIPGVQYVFSGPELDSWYAKQGHPPAAAHNAERSGQLVAMADQRSWFAYYYWLEDKMAPDFARCVAIHKKPGYDPAEMLFRFPGPFGFIYLLLKFIMIYVFHVRGIVDATPLKCDSIRGSHGRLHHGSSKYNPVLITR
ncbi:alkaline-phosphatase-like protein [Tribonema minus]|uniref:Alkaline-phosphatase-like protein n=1 Tax=Tribonema minus TaxID=303371 RepID=A0A836CDW0_9STRA|nr:alkaline-phosphatase-like protein [Tribonema minus]